MKPTSYQGDMKNTAIVNGKNLTLSCRTGREVAKFIAGKSVDRAISDLEKVLKCKLAVPYLRHHDSSSHKRGGVAPGKYPRAASLAVIKLLKGLKLNAENKGLNTDGLKIVHAASQHGPLAWHYGRRRGRRRKLSHFEIVALETEKKKEVKKKSIAEKVKDRVSAKKETKAKEEAKQE